MPLIPSKISSKLNDILPSGYDAIINIKNDGEIISWNNLAEKMYGYTAKETIGKNISIIIPDEFVKKELEIIRKASEGTKIKIYKTARKTKDEDIISVNTTYSGIKDGAGNISAIVNLSRNITRQKSSEEKQSMLAAIVKSSDDAIISKTLDGIITSWNLAAEKMFGYSEFEAIGQHISIIIPEDRMEEETVIINNLRNGLQIDHIETVRRSKNGKDINISLTVSPIKNGKGEIIGASKVVRDISDKRQAEEKQAILASIVSSSDDAIISKTLNGIITSWNAAAEKMFGYTEVEVIGKHITIIIPPERLEEENMIISSIRKGVKIDHFETVRRSKEGKDIYISLTVSPIKNSKGEIIGASKIARDISDKIEMEKSRQLYIKKLQELNNYKDEFMAMASHELKTPLTVISVNLQILQLKLQHDPNILFINKTQQQVKKFSDLINNLLDASKMNAGQLELDPEIFDLSILLKEITADMQHTTSSHKIIYNSQQEELRIYADRQKIAQVFINLLSNSIKYSPAGGDIIFEAKKEKNIILISCRDQGIGIPEKDISNIFDRFYRVSGLASSFSGSGIGLYISSEIIKGHNGKMWAESEPGKGSVVYFSLPALSE